MQASMGKGKQTAPALLKVAAAYARALSLSSRKRKAISRKAARARWAARGAKKKQSEAMQAYWERRRKGVIPSSG